MSKKANLMLGQPVGCIIIILKINTFFLPRKKITKKYWNK